uniref:DNA-directed DNA polymerase n=1 Tax=uncultured Chloroflexota bacterium TaxID=166587 RepID=H5SDX5_9CHLR|nr:phosphotransferase domain-containing protein [uncultured Chloroflexota bacterium]
MENRQLAAVFRRLADLLEIRGEVVYKVLAYRRVADSLEALPFEAQRYWQEGRLREIPGVGEAIEEKLDELLRTGRLGFLERLEAEVPPTLTEWLRVPGLGPKRVGTIWRALGIATLEELEEAARQGRLRHLPGFGARTEANILAGLEALKRSHGRIPLGQALPLAERILEELRHVPGVVRVEMAGSLRRMRSTVGDIDLLAAASHPEALMEAFVRLDGVVRILAQGETKSSVEFFDGLRAQLWVHPPERFGSAWQYATGSKDHNVRLRERALARGFSLSEHALTRLSDGVEILCANEEEVYAALGLPWIPPELREDRGEIEAAERGNLPHLIEIGDIQAELQTHTTWSDGRLSVLEMARAARRRGRRVLAITDHSAGLGVTGGLRAEQHEALQREIEAAQQEMGDSLLILHGAEVEIRADGSLDYPDELLARLDLVIASLHTGLNQPRERVTARLLAAIRNPHVDLIGHPSGRLFPDRPGADLDMEAILQAAAEHGVVLEINAHPSRLDLDDIYARAAAERGVLLSINTDAHSESDLDLLRYGVAIARRAWLTPQQVINTWSPARLQEWLRKRGR